MKLLFFVAVGAVALGIYFHDDVGRMLSRSGGGGGTAAPVVNSMGNMGNAASNNMRSIGRTLGQ